MKELTINYADFRNFQGGFLKSVFEGRWQEQQKASVRRQAARVLVCGVAEAAAAAAAATPTRF